MSKNRTFTSILITIAKAMALMSSLLIAVALSRLLEKEVYGAFRQVLVLYVMAAMVFRVGVPQSIYYFLPRLNAHEQRGFVSQSLFLLVLQGTVFGLFLYLGADLIEKEWNSPNLSSYLKVFALYPIFMLPVMAVENVLMVFNKVWTVVVFNVLTKLAAAFGVIITAYLGYSLELALGVWVSVAFVSLIVALWLMFSVTSGPLLNIKWSYVKEQLSYVYPFCIAAILGALGLHADKVATNYLTGAAGFAEYSNGAFELPFVGVVTGAVTMTLMTPMVQYAKDNHIDKFLGLWHRSQLKVAFALFGMFGFFFFFAKEVIIVLFGIQYESSYIIFQIFLLLIPTRISSFANVMVPLGRRWVYAGSHLIQLLVAYPLCFFLYQYGELTGIAIGLVTAVYTNIFILGFGMKKIMNIPFGQIWLFPNLFKNIAVALISGAASYFILPSPSSQSIIELLAFLIAGFTIYSLLYLGLSNVLKIFDFKEFLSLLPFQTGTSLKTSAAD
ncbi:MAG: hypothetical protein D6B28_04325 [Gammaproteobacteria bacterium]|nr:MAG: hypothetical protein D6B28_04325 [Gammaproteobacteria bacterium]